MRVAALVLLAICSPAHADEWKSADRAMLGTAVALLVVDWGQTRDLTRTYTETSASLNGQTPVITKQRTHREINPVLGDNPSIGEVDKYFALAILGTMGVSYALTPKWRRYFLGTVIVLEGFMVIHNHQIGLRAEF